ncbi:hypothetical protein A2U01_0104373, partial [Trifolium medium]|nr:hypothetical protein [Trifolium medium]
CAPHDLAVSIYPLLTAAADDRRTDQARSHRAAAAGAQRTGLAESNRSAQMENAIEENVPQAGETGAHAPCYIA